MVAVVLTINRSKEKKHRNPFPEKSIEAAMETVTHSPPTSYLTSRLAIIYRELIHN